MKDWKGWLALAIFAAVCYTIGVNRFLMKHMNATVVVMLLVSVVLVALVSSGKAPEDGAPDSEE